MPRRVSTTKGFKRTVTLLGDRIRKAGETRGFAVSRVLTRWTEVAGPDVAAVCQPVDVSYGRAGFGATLTVLTTGSQAPMLEMEKDKLRERVNAAYGYNAIARIRITQTARSGFAEGQVAFLHRPKVEKATRRDPEIDMAAKAAAKEITDSGLRQALERLGQNVLTKAKK